CLDAERLASLTGQAFYACAIGEVGAFLLAFDQTAAYDSPNYLWFRERYPRIVYVDRVVVAPPLRGRGYACQLFADLFHDERRAAQGRARAGVVRSQQRPAKPGLGCLSRRARLSRSRPGGDPSRAEDRPLSRPRDR